MLGDLDKLRMKTLDVSIVVKYSLRRRKMYLYRTHGRNGYFPLFYLLDPSLHLSIFSLLKEVIYENEHT